MVHHLVHPAVVSGEPVVDRGQMAQDTPGDPRFLGDLAHSGFLGCLHTFQMTFRQAPFQAPGAVSPGDDGSVGTPLEHGDDEPARGGRVHDRPVTGTPASPLCGRPPGDARPGALRSGGHNDTVVQAGASSRPPARVPPVYSTTVPPASPQPRALARPRPRTRTRARRRPGGTSRQVPRRGTADPGMAP